MIMSEPLRMPGDAGAEEAPVCEAEGARRAGAKPEGGGTESCGGAEAVREAEAAAPDGAQTAAGAPEAAQPMRWHGFLVRVMLFLAAALHAFQAWQILGGSIYYDAKVRAAVYAGLPALRALDILFAATLIAGAALQLAARFALAARRARGVRLLKAAYGALLGGVAVYDLGRRIIAGLSPLSLPLMAQAGAYLCLLLANGAYYRRRRGAFAPEKGEKK